MWLPLVGEERGRFSMGLNDDGDDDDGFIDWQDAGDLDDAGLLHDSHPHQVQGQLTSICTSLHASTTGQRKFRPYRLGAFHLASTCETAHPCICCW